MQTPSVCLSRSSTLYVRLPLPLIRVFFSRYIWSSGNDIHLHLLFVTTSAPLRSRRKRLMPLAERLARPSRVARVVVMMMLLAHPSRLAMMMMMVHMLRIAGSVRAIVSRTIYKTSIFIPRVIMNTRSATGSHTTFSTNTTTRIRSRHH